MPIAQPCRFVNREWKTSNLLRLFPEANDRRRIPRSRFHERGLEVLIPTETSLKEGLIGFEFERVRHDTCSIRNSQTAMLRNSCRVSALSRKQPNIRLVTKSESGLCTPRVVMQ